MHTLISTDLSELAAQRRAVVFAVSRQVPGADPELATSFGLEQLCREIAVHGAVDRPVDYWHHAAIDAATEASANETSAATASATKTSAAGSSAAGSSAAGSPAAETSAAGAATAELAGTRPAATGPADAAATAVVREEAPSTTPRPAVHTTPGAGRTELPPSIAPAAPTAGPPPATRRTRPASNRPAPGFATVTPLDPAACRITRGAMHDYIRHRLLPGRRRELEDHLVDCAACVRAFTDVRESYWLQQAAPPVVRLGTVSVPDVPPAPAAAAR
ncbi:zf-HC2 domain-containing protein [Myceligenerans pegani]|uniref:Zf-HC2 domain-containing protein n=1 Tax=Myceligenerans pegani TaxID=2776917 RepID=A0ABR9N3R1_9MICO|nr:zf-HC2 domain-containing protein [Myceligenerans sp. TRM 65318]MBE1877901.1 zf-HC2 domain-containing protein [Myceligenerans sp. TRM 65318]MBE3020172.1 zf-HC2 domain-containing protein [Myceligenerans sp. TRM 65318]